MRSWQEACFVIFQVWTKPVTIKSDFGRAYAETIAWAISRGNLTTEVAPGTMEYGNLLKVTRNGLLFMEEILDGLDREAILSLLNGQLEHEEDGELQGEVRLD